MFPEVFLDGVSTLKPRSKENKDCCEIIIKRCNYQILPSCEVDFTNIISTKFRLFLDDISKEITTARNQRLPKYMFFRNVKNRLEARSLDLGGYSDSRGYGDLIEYWEFKAEMFWGFVLIEPYLALQKMRRLSLELTKKFYNKIEGHLVAYSAIEETLSDTYYREVKKQLVAGNIGQEASANDGDIKILTDCLVYAQKRLITGIVYLVTNDNKLDVLAGKVVENPTLACPGGPTTGPLAGFRSVKPALFNKDARKYFSK